MSQYLKQQSVGELFRNTVAIYSRHVPSILGPYLLLLFPIQALQVYATHEKETGLIVLTALVGVPLALVAYGVIVVSISEACLGSRPSILRSFKHVLSNVAWKLAWTS